MAIALDTSASGAPTGSGGASPATFNYTIGGVADPIVFIAVAADGGATVSAVTWNSVSMSLVQTGVLVASPNVNHYLFMLANPATGAHTFSITHSGTPNIYVAAASYSGASATGQPDAAPAANTQNNNPTTVSVTTVADNCWMIGFARDDNDDTITVTAGGTIRQSSGTHTRLFDSDGSVGTAGSHSFTLEHQNALNIYTLAASFKPVAAGAAFTIIGRTVLDYGGD